MALITASQVREHFPQLQGSADDPVLDTLIARADALMALWCGFPRPDAGAHTLTAATYTVYPKAPDPDEPRRIALPVHPVVSLTTVHVDPDELYGASTEVASGDMILDGQAGEVWLTRQSTRTWASEGRANKVVAVAGFATTPPDLVALAASTVRHLVDRRRNQGAQAQSAQGASTTLVDAEALLPQAVRDMLGQYVIWSSRVG